MYDIMYTFTYIHVRIKKTQSQKIENNSNFCN